MGTQPRNRRPLRPKTNIVGRGEGVQAAGNAMRCVSKIDNNTGRLARIFLIATNHYRPSLSRYFFVIASEVSLRTESNKPDLFGPS